MLSKINMMSIRLLILFLALTIIDAQNSCTDSRATCINVQDCSPIMEILQNPRMLKEAKLQILRETNCGVQGNIPLVCCVNQTTPQPTAVPTITQETQEASEATIPDPPDVSNHPNLPLLEHRTCGPLYSRIIRGSKTDIAEFPWMALILYDTGEGIDFRCGGTILNKRYILLAAHCVTMLRGGFRHLGVRVGDHDISKERDCDVDEAGVEIQCAEKYQDFGIESIHYHPEYSPIKRQNDIALIRLNNTIDFRPFNVRAICMPFGSERMLNRSRAIVSGWGTMEIGTLSQELLQKNVPLVNNEQCKEIYKNTTEIWYKQICGGGHRSWTKDSCMGDGGGPLQVTGLYNNTEVRNIQYGIVSFGMTPCGTDSTPDVYTNVAYYMDWILDTIRE